MYREVLLQWLSCVCVCEMRLSGRHPAQYWIEPWEQSGSMPGWVSSVNAEREVSSSLHIDWLMSLVKKIWDLYDSNTLRPFAKLCQEYKLLVNQRWRYHLIGSLLENTFGASLLHEKRNIDQLVPRYCSRLVGKFIKTYCFKFTMGKIFVSFTDNDWFSLWEFPNGFVWR